MYEIVKTWLELKTDRRAVTALEYGLIAALIAAAIVGAVSNLGSNANRIFTNIASNMSTH